MTQAVCRWLLASLLVQSMVGHPVWAQERSSALDIQDLLSMVRLPSSWRTPAVAPAPDGRWVVYVRVDGTSPDASVATAGHPASNPDVWGDVAGASVWAVNVVTHESRRLEVHTRTAWAPSWSPTGERLAFLADSEGTTQLWTWSPRTGELRPTPSVRLAFTAGAHALRWLSDNRTVLAEVPELDGRPGSAPASRLPLMGASEVPTVHVLRYVPGSNGGGAADTPSMAMAPEPARTFDIALVDVETGTVDRLATHVAATWYDVSPDEQRVAYTVRKGIVEGDVNDRCVFDLITVDRATKVPRVVARNILMHYGGVSIRWSPDSRTLAYIGGPLPPGPRDAIRRTARQVFAVPGYLFAVPADSGMPRQVGDRAIAYRATMPVWDAAGGCLYAVGLDTLWRVEIGTGVIRPVAAWPGYHLVGPVPDDAFASQQPPPNPMLFVYARDVRDGHEVINQVDVRSGAARQVVALKQRLSAISMASAAGTIAYQAQDLNHPPDVWMAGPGMSAPVQLTHLNPRIEHAALGRSQMIAWRSLDGDSVRGLLMLPSAYVAGQRYPMVTWVYGGGVWGTSSQTIFGGYGGGANATYNFHLLTARGYAVFVPDIPIHPTTPMADITKVVLPGVDRVIESGVADPNRLGLWGQSYGGYTVMSLLVQTPRFRAAITGASGATELFSVYDQVQADGSDEILGWLEQGQGGMRASPWEYRDRYIENSPFFYLDRVTAPVLVEYGSKDDLAPFSKATFAGLRRLDRRVELIGYDGEGHVVLGAANQRDYWQRAIEWFDTYLKGAVRSHGEAQGAQP